MLEQFNNAVDRAFTWATQPIDRIERWMDERPTIGKTLFSLAIITAAGCLVGGIGVVGFLVYSFLTR